MLSLTINILAFIIAFAGVFYIGERLTFYAKLLGKVTSLGEAFIGTVLVATITSLPELSSGFAAIFIAGNPELMIADVFGSDFFNITVLWLMMLYIIMVKKPVEKPSKEHNYTIMIYSAIPILLVVFYHFSFRSIGFLSIPTLILILLLPFIFKLYGRMENDEDEEFIIPEKYSSVGKRKIITVFFVLSLMIILLGIVLGKTSDFIAHFPFETASGTFVLGSSFVGALFLAISTSLPEVAVTFHSIFKYRSIDLAYGNILGSNLFNVIIFALGDIFTFKTPLISTLGIGNRVLLTALFASSILFIFQEHFNRTFKIIFSFLALAAYFATIIFIFGS